MEEILEFTVNEKSDIFVSAVVNFP